MLFGRQPERARIERVLNEARQGRGGALVLRGAPGIGKTALLRYAIDLGEAMTVVQATGVESEAELEWSGLSELCRPLRDLAGALPERQAEVLRGALGLGAATPGDRFAVGAATLGLLALAAETRPVLAVVDDVQWLDAASVEALAFAARRLADDAVAFLFAVRDDASVLAAGFDELAVEGLDAASAQRLLGEVSGAAVPDEVVTTVLAATQGNPLGLVELPRVLTAEQLAGRERIQDPLPVGTAVAHAYSRSIERLPDETRHALVVLAVSSSGDADLLVEVLGGAGALEPAEDAGLIDLADGRFAFRHPLVRSAVVQAAAPSSRRAAHRLLADALADRGDEERRAWHLAAAAVGHDEDAAEALASVAARARERGGYEAAAEGFERAARLTSDASARASRLADAAEAAWGAGDSARAGALVAEVLPGATDPGTLLRLLPLRGRIELQTGSAQRARDLFLDAAAELEAIDPAASVALLGLAVAACHHGGLVEEALSLAERVRELVPRDGSPPDRQAEYALGRALSIAGRPSASAVLEPVLDGLLALPSPSREELVSASLAAATLERDVESRDLAARATELARTLGPMALAQTLTLLAEVHLRQGEWQRAVAAATEGLELARDLGQQSVATYFLASLVRVEAARGNEDEARFWAAGVSPLLGASGTAVPAACVDYALGLLEFGLERLDDAVPLLEASARNPVAIDMFARPLRPEVDLVEALVRLGRGDEARESVGREPVSRWEAALAARCRGLLAADDGFDAAFEDAVRLHAGVMDPFAEARTRLCYGERLRGAGRRMDARPQLRAALEAFEQLEATAWIKRVRRELRATREKLGRRAAASGDELTPQELQVALQVAEGKTNREAGAALFLSPKTVEFHLARAYRKLELSSRAELIRHFAAQGDAVLELTPG